jgi:hypothetical protein
MTDSDRIAGMVLVLAAHVNELAAQSATVADMLDRLGRELNELDEPRFPLHTNSTVRKLK